MTKLATTLIALSLATPAFAQTNPVPIDFSTAGYAAGAPIRKLYRHAARMAAGIKDILEMGDVGGGGCIER